MSPAEASPSERVVLDALNIPDVPDALAALGAYFGSSSFTLIIVRRK